MVFTSQFFLFFFLPIIIGIYYIIPEKYKQFYLTLISYIFYGWTDALIVLLLLYTTVIIYFSGLFIEKYKYNPYVYLFNFLRINIKKTSAIFTIVNLIFMLGFFKYFVFIQENVNNLLELYGQNVTDVYLIILPIGISFYTFQGISYIVDVYKDDVKATKSFFDLSAYITMFSQLIAGPIIRFSAIQEQLKHRIHNFKKIALGITFFMIGFSKKILLANPMGNLADLAFDSTFISCLEAWIGLIAYSFQIYFDFSAYSDMAVGLGLMLGFSFPKNFDSPYKSISITMFWRKWHITLSTWLKYYLYIPIGGNRKGVNRTYINLMIVMIIGGLWHGASYNFLLWGFIHGFFLSVERYCSAFYKVQFHNFFKIIYTYLIVLIAWVFFRSENIFDAFQYISVLFSIGNFETSSTYILGYMLSNYNILIFTTCIFIIWFTQNSWEYLKIFTYWKVFFILSYFTISIAILILDTYNPFIYFRF